jgi:hypothetical protein
VQYRRIVAALLTLARMLVEICQADDSEQPTTTLDCVNVGEAVALDGLSVTNATGFPSNFDVPRPFLLRQAG